MSTLQAWDKPKRPFTTGQVICFYCLGGRHEGCLGFYTVDGASRNCVCCLRTGGPSVVRVWSKLASGKVLRKRSALKSRRRS